MWQKQLKKLLENFKEGTNFKTRTITYFFRLKIRLFYIIYKDSNITLIKKCQNNLLRNKILKNNLTYSKLCSDTREFNERSRLELLYKDLHFNM